MCIVYWTMKSQHAVYCRDYWPHVLTAQDETNRGINRGERNRNVYSLLDNDVINISG
jgi:hypothetical protein